jgi:ketosteroid isomerase-like protein
VSDDLLARVEALEAERDILATLYRYAHTIDVGDADGWADCFTEDGVFDVTSHVDGYAPYKVEGRENLRDFIEHHTRPPALWHKHMIVEPIFHIDGDTATGDTYFLVLMDHGDEPVVRVFGRYLDTLRREADGVWRFVERRPHLESMRHGLPPFAGGREAADRAYAERSQAASGT